MRFLFLVFAISCWGELAWSPEKMLEMRKWIGDVSLSPNLEEVVYSITETDLKKDRMFTQIYLSSVRGETKIISPEGENCYTPRWSPDGKKIAYLTQGSQKLCLIERGESRVICERKRGIRSYAWAPDSERIAFVSEDLKLDQNPDESLVVFGQEWKVNRLWITDLDGHVSPVTSDSYSVRATGDFGTPPNVEYDWSPDGKEIAFAYSPEGLDAYYLDGSIATIDLVSGKIIPWEKKGQHEVLPRYSPDGKWISYLSSGKKASYDIYHRFEIRSRDGKQWKVLANTPNAAPFLLGPCHLGWNAESTEVIFFEPHRTKFHLVKVPIDGTTPREIDTGDWFFTNPQLSFDRNHWAFIVQSSNEPPEAYVSSLDWFEPIPITLMNQEYLSLPSIHTEVIQWKAKDGLEIEGLLTYPIGYVEGKKYPLLLVIHGGPMAFFNESFLGFPFVYPLPSFAEKGFLILRPNPRGSTGYGIEFTRKNFLDWGGDDFQDLMSGVDFLIEEGIADPNRLGVMGGSYGGFMTAWTVTQTNRFKAASICCGISNLISHRGTTDLHRFYDCYMGDFWKNRELYQERSPLFYAASVQTPCLIQHGTADQRVPLSQGEEFYQALKSLDLPVKMVLYPKMEHGPFELAHQLDLLQGNLDWFTDHLLAP